MQNEIFQVEKSLIEKYNINLQTVRELELVKSYYPDSFSSSENEKLNAAQNNIEDLKNKLQSLEIKPVTQTKVEILISQLKAITDALKESPYGLKLSRNQGLIFETAIYGMIISDIKWAFQSYNHAWSNPYYYYESDSTFDHSKLKQTLIDFRHSLITHQPKDFIELENRVNHCINKINELATQDYEQNILKR